MPNNTPIKITTRITVDNAYILGSTRLDMLYTTIEMFSTPLPDTKYEIMKSSKLIVNDNNAPAKIPGLI